MLLTKMFTWTAAEADGGGRHQRGHPQQARVARRPARAGSASPDASSDGTWTRNCARPPSSVPTAQPSDDLLRAASPAPTAAPPTRSRRTLKSAGERAGIPKRSSAFSIPIATAAKDTSGRNGIITRVSRTVSSALPGSFSKPGASGADERAGEDDAQHARPRPAARRQERQHAVGETECLLVAALLGGPRVGGHEGRREGALGEEIAQQVRDPEADPEGVRVEAGPEQRREDLLADEPEQARDERHRGDEPRRPGDPPLLGLRLLDLGRRAH